MGDFHFFQSEPFIAFLFSVLIFLITLFLAVKRWISFPVMLLMLLFSLAAGVIVNSRNTIQDYFTSSPASIIKEENIQNDAFKTQILKGFEDLQTEIQTEKNNLRTVMNQVQEIFETMEDQRHKLETFMEETRTQLKKEIPAEGTPHATENLN